MQSKDNDLHDFKILITNKRDNKELTKSIFIGAITNPTSAVKITNDITLGFINS